MASADAGGQAGRLRRARLLRRDRRPRLQEDLPVAPGHGPARDLYGAGHRRRQVRLDASSSCASGRARASRSTAAASTRRPSRSSSSLLQYIDGDYGDPATFAALRKALGGAKHPTHYLAIPPSLFGTVVEQLGKSGCADGARVVIEKPFGHDFATGARAERDAAHGLPRVRRSSASTTTSARRPSRTCCTSASRTRSSSRSGTATTWTACRSRWPRSSASRAAASSTTRPARSATSSRTTCSRSSATSRWSRPSRSTRTGSATSRSRSSARSGPLTPEHVVRGQFDGYLKEPGVAPGSTVETFAAVRLEVDSWRWAGVPFFIRAGKSLPLTATEVLVDLKRPPLSRLSPEESNYFRFRLGPKISISIGARVKKPGTEQGSIPTELDGRAQRRQGRGRRLRAPPDRRDEGRSDALRARGRGRGGVDGRRRHPRQRDAGAPVRTGHVGTDRGEPPDHRRRGLARPGEGAVKHEAGGDRRGAAAGRQRRPSRPLEPLGPVPVRAGLGHGARGLQRGRGRLGLLSPRPRALARLPLERRRARRDLRPPPARLLRARALEREGPDPQGAALRPDELRGQPRRGRQGVLVLPRLDADALVHEVPVQVPAGGIPVPAAASRRTAGARSRSPSTSCSTRASSPRAATSTSSSSTRRPARRTSSSRSPSRTAARRRRPSTCCPPCGSATRGRGGRTASARLAAAGAAQGRAAARRRSRRTTSGAATSTSLPTPSCSSPRTRPTPSASSARPTPRPTSRTPSTST